MTRVVSGVAMAVAALGLVWFLSPNQLLVVVLAVCALAFVEYARLVRTVGAPLPFWPTLVATLVACSTVGQPWIHVPSLLVALLIAVAVWLMAGGVHGAPLLHAAGASMLAPLYLGLPLASLVGIHALAGREGVLTLIATVAASDTAQYYAGRAFGRRPLAATISPKKTVEGAVGGLVVAPLILVALSRAWLPWASTPVVAIAGVLIVVAGISGDLFESALKRAAGAKDSGTLIPGHGGVLDRIDALLFAAPVFHLLLMRA